MKNIFQHHIRAKPPYQQAIINPFYKPKKLKVQFSNRKTEVGQSVCELSNMVYSFNCSENSCIASYVGYAVDSAKKRSLDINNVEILEAYTSKTNLLTAEWTQASNPTHPSKANGKK